MGPSHTHSPPPPPPPSAGTKGGEGRAADAYKEHGRHPPSRAPLPPAAPPRALTRPRAARATHVPHASQEPAMPHTLTPTYRDATGALHHVRVEPAPCGCWRV